MNQTKYTSIAEFCGEIVDCRYLSLKFEFYLLPREEAIALIEEAIRWIINFLGNAFVVKWTSNKKQLSADRISVSLTNALHAGKGWSLTQEAYAISPVVYDLKTMNAYNRRVRYEQPPATLVSEDYPAFWNGLFSDGKENDEQIKNFYVFMNLLLDL